MTFIPDDTAICAQVDPELFFPEVGGKGASTALAMCAVCPLIDPCREYALTIVVEGVWGGTTVRGRRTLRRELGITPIDLDRESHMAACTTVAAKARHKRRDEPCDTCWPTDHRTEIMGAAMRELKRQYATTRYPRRRAS